MRPQRSPLDPSPKPNVKVIIAIAVAVVAILLFILLIRSYRNRLPTTTTTTNAPERAPGVGAFPEMAVKPRAVNQPFKGCPAEGDGGDPVFNRLKNRVDEGNYLNVEFEAFEQLPWPKSVERRDRDKWSASDTAEVARYEGTPVVVEGYLADAKKEGPESPNCHGADDEFRDFHIWLTQSAGEDRTNSIVIEMTPPLRAQHPNWTTKALLKVAKAKLRVRVSGWLLLDPEHPDQVGKTRGTIWEVHPVTRLEVQQQGRWIPLDNFS